jgi:catechol 2,3-dioxygenase-like lactoylglutathione lyase family enzyme
MATPTRSAVPALDCVVLDCPDPEALATFYRRLLDWNSELDVQYDGEWVKLENPAGGVSLDFQRVADYRPPNWPSPEQPQQFHLDLRIADMEAGHERALALGARLLDDKPETFRVYADPAGHPFCLCAC